MKLWLILNCDVSLKLIYGGLIGNTTVQGKNKTKKAHLNYTGIERLNNRKKQVRHLRVFHLRKKNLF